MFIKQQNIPVKDLTKLLKGCLRRDRFSQKKVYELYSPVMMVLCLRYSKNREEAEEVLQDGFLQMYKCLEQFGNHGSFEGWLRRIMINCALQRYRGKSNRSNLISLTEEHNFLTTEYDLGDRLNEKELIRLIQGLSPAYRMVFNLHVFEGMKHREIASLLNISEGTSKSNLSDARKILKKQLEPELKIAK
jgi:RNA polymerase sigma-70 factor, ECF subfamily